MSISNLDALRARDDLLAVAASWGALEARLMPSRGASEIRTAPESKPPIVVPVSDLMRQIRDRTRFYANKLIRETNDWAPTTWTMPGLLEQVGARYGHFTNRSTERTALVDFLDDAHEMRRLAAGMLASHEPARWQGPCPGGECTGELYQIRGGIDAKCGACGRIVGAAEWRQIMRDAFDSRLMTLSELVSALVITDHKIPIETIRTWAKRGAKHGDPTRGLVPVYVDPTLYRFADAWALAERRAVRRTA